MASETKLSDDTPVESLPVWKSFITAMQKAGIKTVGEIRQIEDERGLLSIDYLSVNGRRKILQAIGDDPGSSLSDDK
ncbi:MAG: hypothetical protein ACK5N9_06075 [Pirellula sp.]|jgi:hypothetical protein